MNPPTRSSYKYEEYLLSTPMTLRVNSNQSGQQTVHVASLDSTFWKVKVSEQTRRSSQQTSPCYIETSTQIRNMISDHSIYSIMESKDWTNSKQPSVRHNTGIIITANNSIKHVSKFRVHLITYVWIYFIVYRKIIIKNMN